MRKITEIIIHCSATKEGKDFGVKDIDRMHKARGFSGIGYHYLIPLNGDIKNGRSVTHVGAHAKGHNRNSIGICYIGGLDEDGKSKDTRTPEQKKSLKALIESLSLTFPDAEILGHRDLSPDKNGNGKIDKWEWMKACPCFSVKEEYVNL